MRRYKNCFMHEEFQKHKEIKKIKAIVRAEYWTAKRREFEFNHPYLSLILLAGILSLPFILMALIYTRR